MRRVAIYIRVSTSKQDTDNQRRELEAVAKRIRQGGRQGLPGRRHQRRQGQGQATWARCHDEGSERERVRHDRFLVSGSAWSIAYRPAQQLQGLHDKGVGLFLHQQGLDTSTTAGKAMFQMLGVFAEFERGIIRERVNAGLARARANGVKLGRRRVKPSVEAQIVALRDKGHGILRIGKKLGIGTSVVQRVFKEVPWR